MNIRNQKRFIRQLLGIHLEVQYRIAKNRLILMIVGTILFVNIFNHLITNPLNVDSSTNESSSSSTTGLVRFYNFTLGKIIK